MLRRARWLSRLLLIGLLAGIAAAPAARAQIALPEMVAATGFLDRMVRITVQPGPNSPGVSAFGFVVGEQKSIDGTLAAIIVTADHFIRDPARGGAAPYVTFVSFHADLSRSRQATVLSLRLPPEQGDLALLAVAKPDNVVFPPAVMVNSQGLLPGDLVWQDGRTGAWDPAPEAGRFALRDPAGWLLFDSLDAGPGAAGSALLSSRGLVGMVTGPAVAGGQPRALGAEAIAAKFREWGVAWNIPAASVESVPANPLAVVTGGGAAAIGAQAAARPGTAAPGGIRPTTPRGDDAAANAPGMLVEPMTADQQRARSSWVPVGTKVSPWLGKAPVLLAAPRQGASRISMLPQGLQLPRTVWAAGAYQVVRKLDGGAWFLLASDGKELGYVSGNDVIELWPPAAAAAPANARVVRDWVLADDRHAVLRDAGTHYDLSFGLVCRIDLCTVAQAYTPAPPANGAISPTFQAASLRGRWRDGEVVPVHLLLPRAVVDTPGARLVACVGLDEECPEMTILGGQ